jgi:hypothetical protein
MALRGDGMGLGIVKNEAHKFELSSEDSRKAEEMGYEFDYYDAKGWVEKEEDDDFAKGGETKFVNLKTLKGQSEVEKYLQKGWSVKYQGDKFAILQKGGKKMVKGGATFDDKVKAISKNLKGRKVPKKLQKDYGKTYDTKQERDDAARRIAGAMRAEEMGTRKK